MPKALPIISSSNLDFLKLLKKNNNREWFNANKDRFIEEQSAIVLFADALLAELNLHDVIETLSGKKSLHRIYKDSRFSLDKTPYKINWSGNFTRASKSRRGGYVFHIEPGNTYFGGGFQNPNPKDLKLIRDDIGFDDSPLRNILMDEKFIASFGSLRGEQVKTAPKGFDINHEAIDLLRYKQFKVLRKFTDDEVLQPDFVKIAGQTYREMRPFFDYMTEVLITDHNGLNL
ncbi:DUF2461 domain-containing protein [Pedobacter fastidiosus]|uniref:DUF2461 domain-containing protein n=1 Tax=Pedobacter fastidiosus TaxID=2765361 RepID=A0ABR7KX00_9SPHI|nr:DUF2461 domain-containing protein [Pedobacter fastidiosus]MBC6112592.1 DUF2461 domain-containing protein [Pedobacter fastidiosus]